MKQLPKSFFARDTITVAKELLGKIVSVNGMEARIVEAEAYKQDAASHAFRKTKRSAIMHETYGHVYVYLIYGMYHCLNFTSDVRPGAVLIRAAEPLSGVGKMKKNRGTDILAHLCSGPGKLCAALGIDRRFNEKEIGGAVKVFDDGFKVSGIKTSPRIGLREGRHLPWRFFIEGNQFVSRVKENS